MSLTNKFQVGVYGALPNAFDVARKDFLTVYNSQSGLTIGEALYTPAGSQALAIGTYVAEQTLVTPSSGYPWYNQTVVYNYQWSNKTYHYKLRPRVILSSAPLFTFSDRKRDSFFRETMLVSLPMYAKLTGLATIKDVGFQRLVIRLKDGMGASTQD